jgi:hypothetical protein
MPNLVPAAAEGLPENDGNDITAPEFAEMVQAFSTLPQEEKRRFLDQARKIVSRRTALTLTGSGIVAAVAGLAGVVASPVKVVAAEPLGDAITAAACRLAVLMDRFTDEVGGHKAWTAHVYPASLRPNSAPFSLVQSSEATVSPGLAQLIAEHWENVDQANAAAAYSSELDRTLDAPHPRWKPSNRQSFDLQYSREFHSSEQLRNLIAERIEWIKGCEYSNKHHARRIAELEAIQSDGLAMLVPMETAYAPIVASERALAERCAVATDTFKALVAFPCETMADTRAKAVAMLWHPDWLALQTDEDEPVTLLRSLAGKAYREAKL